MAGITPCACRRLLLLRWIVRARSLHEHVDGLSQILAVRRLGANRWILGIIGAGALIGLLWIGAIVAFPDRFARAISPRQAILHDSPDDARAPAVSSTAIDVPTGTMTAAPTVSATFIPTPSPTATPTATSTPLIPIYFPSHLHIPVIGVNAPVMPVSWSLMSQGEATEPVWDVASGAIGWHLNSATPGQKGNVVLAGHHNVDGMVFQDLYRLEPGNEIYLFAGSLIFSYRVREVMIVQEEGASDTQREENARWMGAFPEERLTLISCWPPYDNTHRVIVIAKPQAGAQWITPQE